MAFIFTCGTHTFKSLLEGYENVTVRCQNCGNFSGRIYSRRQWFTFCFVPIIPFSMKPWHEVGCHICNFYQDIKYRPEVEQMKNQGGSQQQIPLQSTQGWSEQPAPLQSPQGWSQQPSQGQGYYMQGPKAEGPPGGPNTMPNRASYG